MNGYQRIWWEQLRADLDVLHLLRKQGVAACHQLHYLQMVTEKLGKAYFWRSGYAPKPTHASFVRFFQALDDRPAADVERIAGLLGFARSQDLERWLPTVIPLAYDLERVAPKLAGFNSPNAEYPWPHAAPTNAPVFFSFRVWSDLTETGRGRQLLRVIDAAVQQFPEYS